MTASVNNKILAWSWALMWFVMPISAKASVLILWVFGLLILYQAMFYKPNFSRSQLIQSGLFAVFFLWQLSVLLLESPDLGSWKIIERKLGLIIIPFLMLFAGNLTGIEKWMARGLYLGLVVSGMHMILIAIYRLTQNQDFLDVIYHNFTAPYGLGAIYYSWYLSIAIAYLILRRQEAFVESYKWLLLAFFTILLLFAASKLFVIISLPLIGWKMYTLALSKKGRFIVITSFVLILLIGLQPFYHRMGELKNTSLAQIQQSQFDYDTPFNGISLRLLQWRFAIEILDDTKSWLTGVGNARKQELLNAKYEHYGVYTGNPDLGDSGYLDYNFHNQYVETLVGGGIVGLLLLVLLFVYSGLYLSRERLFPSYILLIICLFFITESVLERQAGLLMFCLILCTFAPPPQQQIKNYGSPDGR